jgi:hypothetical protein
MKQTRAQIIHTVIHTANQFQFSPALHIIFCLHRGRERASTLPAVVWRCDIHICACSRRNSPIHHLLREKALFPMKAARPAMLNENISFRSRFPRPFSEMTSRAAQHLFHFHQWQTHMCAFFYVLFFFALARRCCLRFPSARALVSSQKSRAAARF